MKPKISTYQFFIMMVLLPYGSAVLFFLAPENKQDAWIAMIIYSLSGIILQLLYISLYNSYKEDTLITYLPKIYGKFLGNVFGILYILYFTYIGSRVVRDFLELINITGFKYTPMWVIGATFMVVTIYGVSRGVETIASVSQAFFIAIISLPLLVGVLLILSEDVFRISNLKPILQDGIIEVIKNGWPLIFFPYGETIVFTMFYPYINEQTKIKKVAVGSIIFEGIILSFVNILFICGLGVDLTVISICPFFQVVQRISVFEFLTRLDIIFVIILIIGGFFKITILMYAAVLGTVQITKIKNIKVFSLIFGMIIFILSLVIAESYLQHIEIGLEFVVKYVHTIFQIVIPLLTFILHYIRKIFYKPRKL
ncbi:GerAB/ArcD/ProY family transporter [Clostridium aestuarii]|uniref:GerAB/ArcD/ProY family transporter n=1 Tax=Clostridium aestuarii TaxID=338193 RepID=A0ABT4CYT7_9CLOT|nr:GerAB/ArcD/ProY family transporter [Clostridium aestuarii]MCY6484136.1 GerAB/ArcD/ProY family transporter [Clostridium aestuarii]